MRLYSLTEEQTPCYFIQLWIQSVRFLYLEIAYGLLQRAVVVQHHSSKLERLDVVLVQHEGLLEALHC